VALLFSLATALAVAFAPRATASVLVLGVTVCSSIWFILKHPHFALRLSLFIVILAWTKFRTRDPLATVSGVLDWQIGLELGLYALLGILAIRIWWDVRAFPGRMRWIDIAAIAYVALAGISIAWSPVPRLTAVRAVQLLIQLGLVLAIVRIFGREGLIRNLTASILVYVAVFGGIALLVPGAGGSSVTEGGFSRHYWFAMSPGDVASVTAVAALLVLARLLYGSPHSPRRWLGIASGRWMALWLVALVILMVAGRTRGVAIAFVAAASVVFLLRFGRSWTVAVGASIVLLAVATILSLNLRPEELLVAGEGSSNPVLQYLYRGQTASELATMSSRSDLWSVVASLVKARPVIGYGYMGSRLVLLREVLWAGYAHNALFQSLLDLGILGTTLLTLLALSPYRLVGQRSTAYTGPGGAAVIALTTFLLLSAIVGESFAGAPGLYTVLFLSVALAAVRPPVTEPESRQGWSLDFAP